MERLPHSSILQVIPTPNSPKPFAVAAKRNSWRLIGKAMFPIRKPNRLSPPPPARPNGPDNHHRLRNCLHVAGLTSVWNEFFGNAHAFRQVSRKPEHFTSPGSMGAPN